jgi:hypothetical protein
MVMPGLWMKLLMKAELKLKLREKSNTSTILASEQSKLIAAVASVKSSDLLLGGIEWAREAARE